MEARTLPRVQESVFGSLAAVAVLLAGLTVFSLVSAGAAAQGPAGPPWPTLGGNMQRTGLGNADGPVIGCVKWRFDTAREPAWTGSIPPAVYPPAGVDSSVVLGTDGTVYFTAEDGCVYALSQDGQVLWKHRFLPASERIWHWPLNEGTGTVAHAAEGGFDGQLVNFEPDDASWVVDDKFGHALQFDGVDDGVRITGFKGIGYSLPRRVSAWVKTTTTALAPIICWGSASGSTGAWRMVINAAGNLQISAEGEAVVASVTVNTGEWTHVEAILPPGAVRLDEIVFYVNGTPAPSSGGTKAVNTAEVSDVYIGFNPVGGASFSGMIADVRIEEIKPVSGIVSGPTIGSDGTAYLGYDKTLYAVNREGTPFWSYETDGFIAGCPAVAAGGRVFFGSADGKVYGLDATGRYEWDFDIPEAGPAGGGVLLSPSLGLDGSAYVGGVYNATLYALDPNDGDIRWQTNLDPGVGHSAKSFVAAPVVGPDGTIYVTLAGGTRLYAVNPTDGSIAWSTDISYKPALLGYWKFDEQYTLALSDASPYRSGRTALVADSSPDQSKLWVPGQINGAMGMYRATVRGFSWPANTKARTIAAWVRRRSPAVGSHGNIIGWQATAAPLDPWVIRVNSTDGRVYVGAEDGYLIGNKPLTDLKWHHVAVVVSADSLPVNIDDIKIYVDGVLDADVAGNGGIRLAGSGISIGGAAQAVDMVLHGTNAETGSSYILDELRLYTVALTPAQIADIMWTQTDVTWHDPVGGTGTPLGDQYTWTEPAVGPDGTLYVAMDDQQLRAIRPDGTIRWVKYLGEEGSHTVTVGQDGLVYAAGQEGRLYVLDHDGKVLASIDTCALVRQCSASPERCWGSSRLSYPVIGPDGTLYASDSNNRVWAIGTEQCAQPGAQLAFTWFTKANLYPDLHINLSDFAELASDWLQCTDDNPPCVDPEPNIWSRVAVTLAWRDMLQTDVNQDRYTDLADLAWMMEVWMAGQ